MKKDSRADYTPSFSACVGPALEDAGFTDLGALNAAVANINCLAYYGVTIGYGDGTFGPGNDVTRGQMVLFMERSARIAGANPADVVQDFATTGSDPVNRADMALLIARLLASATDNDSRVNVVLESGGIFTVGGTEPDDAFIDSRRSQPLTKDSAAGALFELGVAQGTGGGNFSPEAPVTRGQMAAFITRALAHTTARSEGVSIQQYLPGEVTVSVRNEVFAPVVNATIDAFSIASPDAHRAFRSDGSCSSLLSDETGSRSCEIDVLDPVTGPDGDFTIGLGPTDEPEVTVWAWTGALGDVIRGGDDGLVSAEVSTEGVEATGAKVSNSLPENATHARFGRTVTVQLVGVNGLRAVPPEDGASYTIVKEAFRSIDAPATPSGNLWQRSTEVVDVDDTGKIEFTLDGVDPESNDTGGHRRGRDPVALQRHPGGRQPPVRRAGRERAGRLHRRQSGGDHNRPGHPGQIPTGGDGYAAGQQCGDRYRHRSVRPAVQGCHGGALKRQRWLRGLRHRTHRLVGDSPNCLLPFRQRRHS